MAVRILQDDNLDHFLEEEGYAVIPFLDRSEIDALTKFYSDAHPVAKEGLYATAHSDSYDFKKKMNDEILKNFSRSIAEIFYECRPLGGSYIVKYKGEKGVLFPHQDWNIVDEDHYRSFNIWVPLVDTSEENGAIAVLPRSHKLLKSYRGVNIPDPYQKANSHTWQFHKTLRLKAGEALIYDHRLLHASGVNRTGQPRLAVVFGIIPKTAQMRYYYLENGVVGEYENNVEFFFRNDILKGPQGLKKIRDISYDVPSLSNEQFDELYFGKKPASSPSEVGDFYDTHHDKFLQVYGEVIQAYRTTDISKLLDYEIASIGFEKGMRVCDAGCGVCGPAIYFAEKCGITVEAVTISKTQEREARERIRHKGFEDRVHVFQGDYHRLSELFGKEQFDVVYFLESFGHSYDHALAVQSAWAALKPGGYLYIKDLFRKLAVIPEHQPKIDREIARINAAYRYNIGELNTVLNAIRKQGFAIMFVKTIDLKLEDFENLSISNDFQELTGIAKIENWEEYIFPVDFFEIKCYKPQNELQYGTDKYFMQNLYWMQVHKKKQEELDYGKL